jgi:hypothetical protein
MRNSRDDKDEVAVSARDIVEECRHVELLRYALPRTRDELRAPLRLAQRRTPERRVTDDGGAGDGGEPTGAALYRRRNGNARASARAPAAAVMSS